MNYYDYESFLDMKEEFVLLQRELEENGGEFTDEIKERYLSLDEDLEFLIFKAYNIISETEGSVERRNNYIARLQAKNTSSTTSVSSWRKFIIDLVKMRGEINNGGNPSIKISDVKFTVGKSESISVDESFNDARFISWSLGERISAEHMSRIKNFLLQHTDKEEIAFNKVVDKNALKKQLKVELIEGASIVESEKITIS